MAEPKTLGGFEIESRLGAGAMGTVYRAFQRNLKREVVVKTLHPHLAQDPDLVARFEREARHAADLQHPNTVQVYDFGEENGVYFIAMELVRGLDLKQLIRLQGTPPTPLALLILLDVCRGLEAAHDKAIIHRDIKPANLMVTDRGIVKVMDFGLARQAADSSTITVQGSVMGSAAYMSPEQAQGHPVDHRSDIFSTGLVAYELLCGKRAFPGDSYALVLHDVIFADPTPLSEQDPNLDPEVVDLVHHMIVKDADQRCPSIGEARDRLDTITRNLDLRRGDALLAKHVQDGLETLGNEPGPAPVVIGSEPSVSDTEPATQPPEDLEFEDKTRVLDPQDPKSDREGEPVPTEPSSAATSGQRETRSRLPMFARVALLVAVVGLLGWIATLILPRGESTTVNRSGPVIDSTSVEKSGTDRFDAPSERDSSNLGGAAEAIVPADTMSTQRPDSTHPIASEPVTGQQTESVPASHSETQESTRPAFEKRYYIGTIPWAYVLVDNDPTPRNDPQGFQITLKEGRRRFTCKNKAGDIVGELSYTVSRGDPNTVLILNIETGRVEARP